MLRWECDYSEGMLNMGILGKYSTGPPPKYSLIHG